MKKGLQKILLLIAVITVTTHSILPHVHHEETLVAFQQHHHDEDPPAGQNHEDDPGEDSHHSLFSFAQLDENFIPVKWQNAGVQIPLLYVVSRLITYQLNLAEVRSKTFFGYYKEFPPPGIFLSNLFSRPPPSC